MSMNKTKIEIIKKTQIKNLKLKKPWSMKN